MNALNARLQFTVTDEDRSLTLEQGRHFRIYPTGGDQRSREELSTRQIDLLRIATAVHVADSWVRRRKAFNGYRRPKIDIEVLNPDFWNSPLVEQLLKDCVDIVSGEDDWTFRFRQSTGARHEHQRRLSWRNDPAPLVALYSGGLDSAAGLAIRISQEPGRMVIPVTARHQMQKGRLIRDQLDLLFKSRRASRDDLKPFQAGAFLKRRQIRRDFNADLREVTHRCRPLLYTALAGLVADSVGSSKVEIFESGVGSLNLPLASGEAYWRTTRSSHPHFLRLVSRLVSEVNERPVDFVLPFVEYTKAEVVEKLIPLGLAEVARRSVSCILHPLKRPHGRQCGYCPACVYRRHAMITAGIEESDLAYEYDLFSPRSEFAEIPNERLRWIRVFHQQAMRLSELDEADVPLFFRTYLYATKVVSTDEELAPYVRVHRRYAKEWEYLIELARRPRLPWSNTPRSVQFAGACQ